MIRVTDAVALLAVPACSALIGALPAVADTGTSGEWAILGAAIFTGILAITGAVLGLLLALVNGRIPWEQRWISILIFTFGDALLTPLAANLASGLVNPHYRRLWGEILGLGVIAGAVAGGVMAVIGLLIRYFMLRGHRS